MQRLRSEFGVYGLDSGRICVAAINSRNIDAVAGLASRQASCRASATPSAATELPRVALVYCAFACAAGRARCEDTGKFCCTAAISGLRWDTVGTASAVTDRGPGSPSRRQDKMLYQIYETQRALMAPFSEFASASAKLYNHPLSPFAHAPMAQRVSAGFDLLHRLAKEYEKPPFDITSATRRRRRRRRAGAGGAGQALLPPAALQALHRRPEGAGRR